MTRRVELFVYSFTNFVEATKDLWYITDIIIADRIIYFLAKIFKIKGVIKDE